MTPATILVVDDLDINREFLVLLLESVGYRTVEAINGADALNIAKREKVALTISDILMPVMDGVEFANRLHAEVISERIPIIFYTATYRANEAHFLAQFCGVDLVLGKPAEPQAILDAVSALLGNSDAQLVSRKTNGSCRASQPAIQKLQRQLNTAFRDSPRALSDTASVRPVSKESMYATGNMQSLSLRTAALLELSMTLTAEHEPQQLVEQFCRAAQDIMSAKLVAVGMFGDGSQQRYAQRGMRENDVAALVNMFDPNIGISRELLAGGELLNSMTTAKNHPFIQQLPDGHPLKRNCMLIPIVLRSHPHGWLYVAEKLGAASFNDEDEQFATTLGAQLAPVYENLILYEKVKQHSHELERQAHRIERANRHYGVLSGVNSAITRIHRRADLFQEICRLVVTRGGFNTVWVGVPNADAPDADGGDVAAWFGGDGSDLAELKFRSLPGTIFSSLPASVVLREKRAVICNHVEADPTLASIKDVFCSHGHHAVAAWPLTVENEVVAVISFYVSQAGFFDDDQIALLSELADDLAFGLHFIGQAEAETRMAQRLTATLESITDAFIMVDRNWNFTYLNSDAERMLFCPRHEVLGMNIWEKFPDAVGGKFYQEYHKALEQNCTVSFEEYYEPLNLWVEIRAYPSDEGLAIYFADIGARKAAEAEINALAFYDKLTSLPNRQLLLNRLDHAIGLCKLDERPGAVLFIDLDNFKSINDTRGHDKGDLLLQQVATRLTKAVRATDTVARIGGDEYVILLENHGRTNDEVAISAKTVAENVIESFREPFNIAGEPQYSTCSIGIAGFDEHTVSFEDVLKRADLAMYQAKATGRNAMSFFSLDMQARIIKRVALETDLRIALANHEFLLHYQPQMNIDNVMVGVEALVRWDSPVRGLVPPADFIFIAEDTGLILPLGKWVLKTACELLVKWAGQAKTENLIMAVNVSAPQFHHPEFVQQVLAVVQETGINPNRLKLELTESLLVNDIAGTIQKMNALKKIGILFSLDDFGTGYSSLSYLHRLPLDQLKIDQSFIRDALNDENAAVIARTVLALGKALNLNVIAEGVETTAHLEFIRKEGCQEYQGYLFSKPLPLAELEEFIGNAKTI